MSTVNTIIEEFIKNNESFNIDEVKLLVSQVLLVQEYNKELYNKLVDNNFKLFRNNLVKKLKETNISIDNFNKLFNENKISSFVDLNSMIKDSEEDNLTNLFKILDTKNKYVNVILYLWSKFSKDNKIIINSNNVSFIEKKFEGNYEDYLYFIIVRITKLNINQLEKLYPNEEYQEELSLTLSEDSSNHLSELSPEEIVEETNNYDMEYIKILEHNINDLQSQVQNIYDNILPGFNKLKEDIDEMKNNLDNHQKYTRNSISILEDRFSKLFGIVKQIKL